MVKFGRRLIIAICDFNEPKYEQICEECVIHRHKTRDYPLFCVSPNTKWGKYLLNLVAMLTRNAKVTDGEF